MNNLRSASLRNFSGGWNSSDNQYFMSSEFLAVSDNIRIGQNKSIAPRYGYRMAYNLKAGTETAVTNQSCTYTTVSGSPRVIINWTGHPFVANGSIGYGTIPAQHITFTTVSAVEWPIGSSVSAELVGNTYGIEYIDANSFAIYTRNPATADKTTKSLTITAATRDTHALGGTPIEIAFFRGYYFVFSGCGEIVQFHPNQQYAWPVWNARIAAASSVAPWRQCSHVSYDTFKQSLIVVNGRDNDKPLEITRVNDLASVDYLVDPATVSNAFVPRGDFVLCFASYVLIFATDNVSGPGASSTYVDISAAGTSGVFVGNLDPDDAVQVDLGRITNTLDPRITGCGAIRDKVFVAFPDASMLGTLGTYAADVHEPNFSDQIPQHGAINHRTIVNIGNDILMCDQFGVPSLRQSTATDSIVPQRVSLPISNEIAQHLAILSSIDLSKKVFSVFNQRELEYMLFVPKFATYANDGTKVVASDSFSGVTASSIYPGRIDAFIVSDVTFGEAKIIAYVPSHRLEAGDTLHVRNAAALIDVEAAWLNGLRTVDSVIDNDYVTLNIGGTPTQNNVSGGGQIGATSTVFTPISTEVFCYSFMYSPQLNIKRWTRYKDLEFVAGAVSNLGEVMFVKPNGRMYLFGTVDHPIYADGYGDYDSIWQKNTAYAVGDIVRERNEGTAYQAAPSYICLVAHTSSNAGGSTLTTDIADHPTYWQEYEGEEISFVVETPWSDVKKREALKLVQHLIADAQGTANFTVDCFVDGFYRDRDGVYTPVATMVYTAADVGGFGAGAQSFGTGRRTKEQELYEFPAVGKLLKLRLSGSTTKKLTISNLTLLYQLGGPLL